MSTAVTEFPTSARRPPRLIANGKTVMVTRERRGLTRTALGSAIGKSLSWVSRAERGGIPIQDDTLTDCANALSVTKEFLCARIPDEPPEGVHFRSNVVTQRAKNQAITHANWLAWVLNEIHNETDSEPHYPWSLPEFDIDRLDGGPAEAAQILRNTMGLRGPIRNLTGVLENTGVYILPMPAGLTGIHAVTVRSTGPVTAVILLDQDQPEGRQRHNLAHELGHLVLDNVPSSVRSIKEREADADAFAGEFLAPYEEFRDTVRGITPARIDHLDELRLEWGVSVPSLVRRTYLQGDITEMQYRYWFRTLNQRNMVYDERTVGFPVVPSGVRNFLAGVRGARYSAADLCSMTHTHLRELQDAIGDQWPFATIRPELQSVPPAH